MNLEQQKLRLRLEIDMAEKKLIQNVSQVNVVDYVMPDISNFANILQLFKGEPVHIAKGMEQISKKFIDSDHWINKILHYLPFILQVKDQFFGKEED